VVVFAANHGVTAEGVSPYPSEVTAQMVKNFAAGGAAINALARAAQAEVVVVDVGVDRGTRNFAREPAMTEEEMQALERGGRRHGGRAEGVALLGLGEMGIGNTTAASAVTAALTGLPPISRDRRRNRSRRSGAAAQMRGHREALEATPSPREPLQVLGRGWARIAALAGFRSAAAQRLAVVVDGFIASAAFAIPRTRAQGEGLRLLLASLDGARPSALLDFLGVEPLLDLGLRLGGEPGPLSRCRSRRRRRRPQRDGDVRRRRVSDKA
jgi:nicotinate-nucleotide--dimethylbenzimidazole phosphoribosyltransferase